LLGRPDLAPDPDRLDHEEFQLVEAWPTVAELLLAKVDGLHPCEAMELLQAQTYLPFAERGFDRRPVEEAMLLRDKRCGRKRKASSVMPG
jgi:hypothetical protein